MSPKLSRQDFAQRLRALDSYPILDLGNVHRSLAEHQDLRTFADIARRFLTRDQGPGT